MRALGKTPNDPLLKSMSPIEWKLAMLNIIEDEKETNDKIKNLVDLAVRIFVGPPKEKGESEPESLIKNGYVGQEPTKDNPDIKFNAGGHQIRKVMSTEFDKILQSGGKYKGFGAEVIKKDKKDG